ncbi:MAG: ATP phosphoribosyltransferase [Pseudomonadota bacterium]
MSTMVKSNETQVGNRIKIAIQKSGRLAEHSLKLLERSGLQFARSKDKLFWYGRNLPVDLLLVRDDDIPRLLLEGMCDLGIVGQNVAIEKLLDAQKKQPCAELETLTELDFGHCKLMLALPESHNYASAQQLNGARIATSYPRLTQQWLNEQNVAADIVLLNGAVEIAPSLGTADAIVDLVSTGTTLRANHLRAVETVAISQAALYRGCSELSAESTSLLDKLVQRISGVQRAAETKYVMFHVPRSELSTIAEILPGAESPTVLPLEGQPERVAVHALCTEQVFWEHLEALKRAGASAILVLPVEKMLA